VVRYGDADLDDLRFRGSRLVDQARHPLRALPESTPIGMPRACGEGNALGETIRGRHEPGERLGRNGCGRLSGMGSYRPGLPWTRSRGISTVSRENLWSLGAARWRFGVSMAGGHSSPPNPGESEDAAIRPGHPLSPVSQREPLN